MNRDLLSLIVTAVPLLASPSPPRLLYPTDLCVRPVSLAEHHLAAELRVLSNGRRAAVPTEESPLEASVSQPERVEPTPPLDLQLRVGSRAGGIVVLLEPAPRMH